MENLVAPCEDEPRVPADENWRVSARCALRGKAKRDGRRILRNRATSANPDVSCETAPVLRNPATPANHATSAKPCHTTPECGKLVVLRTILSCNKARTRSSSAPLKPIMRRTKLSTSTEQSPARQEQQPLARLPRCRLHPGAHRHGGSCGARRCRSNALPSLGQARPHGGTAPRA